MQLLDWSFLTFFVAGGLLVFWYLILGSLLIFVTPKEVKGYAYTSEHYTKVELALVSGFHFGTLFHGVALLAAIAFPKLGTKRKLTDIRNVCPAWLIPVATIYWTVLLIAVAAIFISLVIMTLV
ncbi:hypothetical protein ACOMICROBIO_EPCKBFOG_02228 [Vibrio sp. B1FLJ16]|nr:hypothetical protein ACOMICROBIO_EPCKBFOG_02228 [Vibrio sp. B1FLJ16]CAE6914419.1 hypothetical protein ACOMICROBIO_EPCKBFOG_02228 [Vibrio sp. B1FLJ16]